MSSEYKPLFNRTYLKVMPLIVAVAILLLSLGNKEAPAYTDIAPGIYSLEQPNHTAALTLVFPLPEHLNPAQQTAWQALVEIQPFGWSGSIDWQADRLVIEWSSLPDALLSQLDDLEQQLDSALAQALPKAAARAYLQPVDEQLLSQFRATLSRDNTPLSAKRILANSPLVLINSAHIGPDSETLRTFEKTLRQRYPEAFSLPRANTQTISAHLTAHQRNGYQILIGQPLTRGDQLTLQTVSLLYLQQQLAALLPSAVQGSFRIIMQPYQPNGHWALLMERNSAFPADTFQRLLDHSQKTLNDAALAAIKAPLHEQQQALQNDPEKRRVQQITQLFYGEADHPNRFRDTLDNIQTDDVKAMLKQLLDPASSIVIFQSPE